MSLLLGHQKQSLVKHGIGYDESSEVILLKPNTLGKRFTTSSTKNLSSVNDRLNMDALTKPKRKRSKDEMVS